MLCRNKQRVEDLAPRLHAQDRLEVWPTGSSAYGVDDCETRVGILGEDLPDLCGMIRLRAKADAAVLIPVTIREDSTARSVDRERIDLLVLVRVRLFGRHVHEHGIDRSFGGWLAEFLKCLHRHLTAKDAAITGIDDAPAFILQLEAQFAKATLRIVYDQRLGLREPRKQYLLLDECLDR